MLIVSVIGLKGGTSKTTSAVFAAHALHELGRRVLLVDADPQQSAAEWQDLSPEPFPFRVMRLDTPHLDQQLPDVIRGRYDAVIVDTPPRDQQAGIVTAALRVATVALVPVAPNPIEYRRLAAVRSVVGDVPMAVLLTRVVANSVSSLVYRESVLRDGLWLLGTHVGRLERFAQAFGDPVHQAADGAYGGVVRELLERTGT